MSSTTKIFRNSNFAISSPKSREKWNNLIIFLDKIHPLLVEENKQNESVQKLGLFLSNPYPPDALFSFGERLYEITFACWKPESMNDILIRKLITEYSGVAVVSLERASLEICEKMARHIIDGYIEFKKLEDQDIVLKLANTKGV